MPNTKLALEDILEKCWYVLHRDGYYHTSLSKLAQEVGLGKAGLLHHFGSKEALMRAVLDFATQRYQSYVLSVADEPLSLEERYEKMLRRQNRLAKIDGRGCFFGNTVAETSQEKTFNVQIQDFFLKWQRCLQLMFNEKLAAEQAKQLAYTSLVEYQGAVILYKLTLDATHLEKYVDRSLERLKSLSHENS